MSRIKFVSLLVVLSCLAMVALAIKANHKDGSVIVIHRGVSSTSSFMVDGEEWSSETSETAFAIAKLDIASIKLVDVRRLPPSKEYKGICNPAEALRRLEVADLIPLDEQFMLELQHNCAALENSVLKDQKCHLYFGGTKRTDPSGRRFIYSLDRYDGGWTDNLHLITAEGHVEGLFVVVPK